MDNNSIALLNPDDLSSDLPKLNIQTDCPVCMQPFSEGRRIPVMICIRQHNVCRACLRNILSNTAFDREPACPECRMAIRPQIVTANRLMLAFCKYVTQISQMKPPPKDDTEVQNLKRELVQVYSRIQEQETKIFQLVGRVSELQVENKTLKEEKAQLQQTIKAIEDNMVNQTDKDEYDSYFGTIVDESQLFSTSHKTVTPPPDYTELLRQENQLNDTQLNLNRKLDGWQAVQSMIAFKWTLTIKLDLSNNNIGNKGIKVLTSVKWLNLKILLLVNNSIEKLQWQPGNIQSLTHLNLSNNQLRDLPQNFQALRQLSELILFNNKFYMISRVFLQMSSLKLINVAKNMINQKSNSKRIEQMKKKEVYVQI